MLLPRKRRATNAQDMFADLARRGFGQLLDQRDRPWSFEVRHVRARELS